MKKISVLVLFLGLIQVSHAALVDKIYATVNSEVILLSDIEQFEKTLPLRKELDPLFGFSAGMENEKPDRKTTLDFLITERLIAQSFKVSDAEVEQEVLSVQRNNKLTREDLITFLKSKNFVYDDYYELMKVGLQKRALLDREIRNRVNISEDDIRNHYFNTLSKNSSATMDYNISLIAVNYQTYKNSKAAEQMAKDTLQRLRQGESFAEVARSTSDDPSSQNGGELGFLSQDTLAEPLKLAVKKMQIGSLSELVKTPTGFVILKLNDIRSGENQKMQDAKEQIREQLAKDEYKKQLFLWAERAKNTAYVHAN